MKIDRRLNLVLPLVEGDGTNKKIRGYVHSSAIASDVFHAYYKPMGRALNAIYRDSLGLMGARLAHLTLKDAAKELGMWEGEAGVERGLMNEIYQKTMVMLPGQNGWESVPYLQAGLSAEDRDEIEGAVVYFTLASSLHRRAEAEKIINSASNLWSAQTESLNSTEFLNSLRTSSKAESSGASPTA